MSTKEVPLLKVVEMKLKHAQQIEVIPVTSEAYRLARYEVQNRFSLTNNLKVLGWCSVAALGHPVRDGQMRALIIEWQGQLRWMLEPDEGEAAGTSTEVPQLFLV